MLKRLLFAALLALVPALAVAQQTVLQGGSWTAGHAPGYVNSGGSQPIVVDSGPASGGNSSQGLSELNITPRCSSYPCAQDGTGQESTHFQIQDAPTTNSGGYHYFSFDANAQGGALMAYGAAGGASALPFHFIVNGATYTFPFTVGGITGPTTSVVDDVACWNNTIGSLLKDCGAAVSTSSNNAWTGTNSWAGTSTFNGTANFTSTFEIGGTTETFPASGAIVGTTDTQPLTNKTFDTASNVFKINGTQITNATGTGKAVLDTSPTISSPSLITPNLGVATATSINGLTISSSTGTLAIANGKTFTAGNTMTLTGTDGASLNISAVLLNPQGRLTLVSGTPVMTADETAKGTIYYTPYQGDVLPIYNGTQFVNTVFSEMSVTLDATNALSGSLYDLFVYNDSGTIRLGYGPAWTSSTSRGTGVGTTEIQMLQGVWTNKNAITLRYDSTHTTSVAANQGSYVGTFYATANGQTGMAFTPAVAAGGTANILGLYNAYNRVSVRSLERDSTASWTYSTATWRPTNNSSSDRISFVDGLQQSTVGTSFAVGTSSSGGNNGMAGAVLDSTSAAPASSSTSAATNSSTLSGNAVFQPQLGFHFVQGMEYAQGATITFAGVVASQQIHGLSISLEM